MVFCGIIKQDSFCHHKNYLAGYAGKGATSISRFLVGQDPFRWYVFRQSFQGHFRQILFLPGGFASKD